MSSETRFLILTALVVAVIAYGSLYPFAPQVPAEGSGALATLLRSWGTMPSSRSDFVANILLYMPLGWFGILSMPPRIGVAIRFLLIVIGGTLLSLTMELAQYYDAGRVTSFDDVYSNVLGTMTGGLVGINLGGRWRVPLIAELSARPIPAVLMAAWAGYRLYPYVPAIGLHKYWTAVKPLLFDPDFSLGALYRHAAIWLAAFMLLALLSGTRRPVLLALLFCAAALAARVMIVDTVLSAAELAGAAAALCLWPLLLAMPPRRRAATLFLLLGGAVILDRLQPFQFLPAARDFGWVPFRSLMTGAIGANIVAFCEKTFLYGTLLYLFTEAGGRLRSAVVIVGGMVFAASWIQTYLPGRSAEITDTLIVLLLAGGFALLQGRQQPTQAHPGSAFRHPGKGCP